jgi:TRAP-type C4-dicarboxylate transport system substrate-binding protein
MNLKFWQGLPKNIQQLIMESANTSFRNAISDYFINPKLATSDVGILKIWEEQGVKVSVGNREAFREKTRPVVAKWREKIGKDLVDSVLKLGGYE